MKKEQLSDALDLLHDDILEQASQVRRGKYRKRGTWAKWVAAAACLAIVLYAGTQLLAPKTPNSPTQADASQSPENHADNTPEHAALQMLTIADSSDGMGSESYMAYDVSALINANPWTQSTVISTLPVYQNKQIGSENQKVSEADFEAMRVCLLEIADRLGLDTASAVITNDAPDEETKQIITKKFEAAGTSVPADYFDATKLILEADGLRIQVDRSMTAEISFSPTLSLPENCHFTHYASYEQLQQVAAYLQDAYSALMDFEHPVANISGGDYNINGQQLYALSFYDASGSDATQIVNYNFNRVCFYCDDDGRLSLIRIFQPDLSDKCGDYPIITIDQATALLQNGNYITSVSDEMPGIDAIAKVELVYKTEALNPYYMPYYRFYIALPEEEAGNGMKTYGTYYVPAVASTYISNMPQQDTAFGG